jgi:hypothetical protein
MWSPLTLTPPLKVDRGQWRPRAGLAWAYWNRPITPQGPTSKQQLVPGLGLFESFDLDFEAPSAAPDLRSSWLSPASKFSSLRWSELCCLSAPATAKLILALGRSSLTSDLEGWSQALSAFNSVTMPGRFFHAPLVHQCLWCCALLPPSAMA